ncbi:MAG TPA: LptA/OstA family protein [Dongiaceae bacterium]
MSSRRANGRFAAAMIWTVFAGAVCLAGGAVPLAAQTGATDPLATGQAGTPVEIEATEGIEWRRNDKTYIARGNATAVRGDLRVRANTLTARYREKAGGDNEIYQIEADGGVVLTQPGRTIYGNHAVYNLDSRTLTLTGGNLRVVTAKETVTARDQLEYRERERLVIAQGEVMVESGARRIGADMMTGHFDRLADGSLSLARIEAEGNITVKTKDTFARSQKGEYDLGQDIMTLTGDVRITNGQNQFNGERAEVNVATGVSTLQGGGDGKVKSLIMPSSGDGTQ